MFASSSKPGAASPPDRHRAFSRRARGFGTAPSFATVSYAFVLSTLAVTAGCGENVLVGNWQLRSLSDAGIDLPAEADAAPNTKAEQAQAAREKQHKLKSEQKGDHDDRSNGDKANPGH